MELIVIIFIIIIFVKLWKRSDVYVDKFGYYRFISNNRLVHRDVAYWQIYKLNREKYPLRFGQYVIHHKDLNKLNNSVDNLQIVTPEEHYTIHFLD